MTDLEKGLSQEEGELRFQLYGPNALPSGKNPLITLILRQFRGVFTILLILAATISFVLKEPVDGSFIVLFIVLGTVLNVYQEYKSNRAVEKLKSYLIPTAKVLRGGNLEEIPSTRLVPGDLLKLETGDILPADGVLRLGGVFKVDEGTFTGESVSVVKIPCQRDQDWSSPDHQLLQGSVIISGNGLCEVTQTGIHTRLAEIAQKTSEVPLDSDLDKGIQKISQFILRVTLVTLAFMILAKRLLEGSNLNFPQLLLFSIALAISVIPEALPLVLTFTLSKGAILFAQNDVIVKRLSSVQDLGSINLLCTDKTGTITENRLVLSETIKNSDSKYDPLLLARLASTDLNKKNPEPFDRACQEALTKELVEQIPWFEVLKEESFDPSIRSNGVIVLDPEGKKVHIRRGSPEYFFQQGLFPEKRMEQWLAKEEKAGHRVLGVSYEREGNLVFSGFLSFVDQLKPSTMETLLEAQKLGLLITILTGDSLFVAEAVGREIGLVKKSEEVCLADDFFRFSSLEQQENIGNIRVFARTTPEQKLLLIQLLKQKFTVGFLGEGINDAPALKAANVSMVVQSASDVARETADIVLLKKDLNVIVYGIQLGRMTHANTVKYIRATLISNFGNFYAMCIGSLLIHFLPMLPKQILLLNLLSDFPMMAIAFDRVSEEEIARPQQNDFHFLYSVILTLGLISTVFDFLYFSMFYRQSPAILQTNWFIASVFTEILLLFSIRSYLPMKRAGMPSKGIIGLSASALIATVLLTVIPATKTFFGFHQPSVLHIGWILSLALLYLLLTEKVKHRLVKTFRKIR